MRPPVPLQRRLAGIHLPVYPTQALHQLIRERIHAAAEYRRRVVEASDADPWRTRATILEGFTDLSFAPQSRMAREDVLRNDHCFDAVISAYTAFLWARDGWETPAGVFAEDGWITAPP